LKKTTKNILTLLTLSTLAAPVLADNFYIGGSVGQAEWDDLCDGISASSCDTKDTAYKIFGGYKLNKHFAVEAFYNDSGEYSASGADFDADAEADSFGVAFVGILPLSEQFDLFAKVGVHRWDFEAVGTVDSTVVTVDDSGTDVMYGVGASYSLTDSVAIRAEWENYSADDDITVLSAGVTYSF
jgi:OOP family OmpA-OmpF porin